jgi:hypothetical protein
MTIPAPCALSCVLRGAQGPLVDHVLAAARRAAEHSLFERLVRPADVRTFMEHHVWAVWDFMSLLKSVQEAVAPVRLPWRPVEDAEAARLVHEIVLGEECDEGPDGRPASHFEIYLRAMDSAGADTGPVRRLLALVARGAAVPAALAEAGAPWAARAFVETTLAVCLGPAHGRVAALTIGREEIIPAMFERAIRGLAVTQAGGAPGADLGGLVWYLDRHVTLDGGRHGPMTARLFERICGRDERTMQESLEVALRALERRVALWTAAEEAIRRRAAA